MMQQPLMVLTSGDTMNVGPVALETRTVPGPSHLMMTARFDSGSISGTARRQRALRAHSAYHKEQAVMVSMGVPTKADPLFLVGTRYHRFT